MPVGQKDNTLFITTDVHFTEVFKYTRFECGSYSFHEIVVDRTTRSCSPTVPLTRLRGRKVCSFTDRKMQDDVTTWEEALTWFNYATIAINDASKLVVNIKDTWGKIAYGLQLLPK